MANAQDGDDAPSLLDCTSADLATYLLIHRFKEDAVSTATFLLECTASLPNAEEISAQLIGGGGDRVKGAAELDLNAAVETKDDDGVDTTKKDKEEEPKKESIEGSEKEGGNEEEGLPLGDRLPLPYGSPDENTAPPADDKGTGDSLNVVEVSAVTPRGKFQLSVHQRGWRLRSNAKSGEHLAVHRNAVKDVIIFPKPEDCRRKTGGGNGKKKKKKVESRPGRMVLIVFKEEDEGGNKMVTFRGKTLRQLCFQLPSIALDGENEVGTEDYDGTAPQKAATKDPEQAWMDLLASSFGLAKHHGVVQVANPAYPPTMPGRVNMYSFKSDESENTSTTTGGMPFVRCYHGVNDGVLYPLKEGLLFFKPPLFIHRSALHSISCGRGTGSGSRYVDMHLTLDGDDGTDGATMEFTNINRDELRVLNEYIHGVLVKAMAADAAADDDDDRDNDNEEEEEAECNVDGEDATGSDDGDDDDNDVVVTGVTKGQPPKQEQRSSRPRSQRAASRDAREATRVQMMQSAPAGDDDEEDSDEEDVDFHVHDDDGNNDESDNDDDGDVELEDGVSDDHRDSEDDEDFDDDDAEEDGGGDETESDSEEEEEAAPKRKKART